MTAVLLVAVVWLAFMVGWWIRGQPPAVDPTDNVGVYWMFSWSFDHPKHGHYPIHYSFGPTSRVKAPWEPCEVVRKKWLKIADKWRRQGNGIIVSACKPVLVPGFNQ